MTPSVIDAVRRSLGRTADSPVGPRPAVCGPRRPGPPETEVQKFLDEVTGLSGTARFIPSPLLAGAFRDLVAEEGIRKAAVWNSERLRRLGAAEILAGLGVELIAPSSGNSELAGCDLGVTEADYLLAETGTLVLRASAERPRALSLLPQVHLAVVRPDMLRADLHEVFAEAKDSRYLVFITGASRTGDIELIHTLGVHGPKKLYVWMMAE